MKMLVIGDNCFDVVLKGKYGMKSDSNNIIEQYSMRPAGSGINFALAFSKINGNPYYFTPISKDHFGDFFIDLFNENKILFFKKRSSRPTPLIFALVGDNGKRVTFALISKCAYTDISSLEFSTISDKCRYLYISSGINTEKKVQIEVVKIVEMAKKKGMKIFFDPQFRIGRSVKGFLETNIAIFKSADIVFANEQEIKDFPPSIVKDKIAANGIVVIKKGSKGAEAHTKHKKYDVNGILVNALDGIGAGDVFNAVFLKTYLDGKDVYESLEFANCAAALSTTRVGVYTPTLKEISRFCHNFLKK
jgi:sugar/nucleoside kinase (ribokinase family)